MGLSKSTGGVNASGWIVAESRGGVSPLAWVQPATVLIDQALNDYEVVWAAAGHPHAVFPTNFNQLIEATGAEPMIVGD